MAARLPQGAKRHKGCGMKLRARFLPILLLPLLAACQSNPLQVQRSACPAVAVASYTGDITLFGPGLPPDAANVDVSATITNVRDACRESADQLVSEITYDVVAQRGAAGPARDVQLPVFVTIIQGGNLINAKQVGQVVVRFGDGAVRGVGRGTATTSVSRAAASLPPAILERINRKRRVGELDAATDPLADPEVKAAMRAASFEVLIGFQLDERSLAYNIAK